MGLEAVGFMYKNRYHLLFITIVGFLVYFKILFNGFVWEDKPLIIDNPMGHGFNIFSSSNSFNLEGQYRPVTAFYSALIYAFFHGSSFFSHLFQIGLHIINTIAIFILFQRFFKRFISLYLAILFLVHPINVESIAYFGSFNNPLFFMFGVGALLLSMKGDTRRKKIAIFSLLLLSIFTRETGMLFLVIIPLYQYIFKRKHFYVSFGLAIIVLVIYFAVKLNVGLYVPQYAAPISTLTFIDRMIHVPAIVWYYIKTFFLPLNLSVYQTWTITGTTLDGFYFPLVFDLFFFVGVAVFGVFLYQNYKRSFIVYIFFTIFFSLGLLLHLQIVPLDMIVADRWFYFPIVGLIGMIGCLIETMQIRNNKWKITAIGFLSMILVIFSIQTVIRTGDWYDTIKLFTHDRKINDNYVLENYLGGEYYSQKQYDRAIMSYEKSMLLFPNKVATSNLSELLAFYGSPKKARDFIENALTHYKEDGGLWADLAIAEYKLGNFQKALAAAKQAKKLLPIKKINDLYTQILNQKPLNYDLILTP